MPNHIDSLMLIDKPSGFTSHDVVNVVRKKTGEKRVGHAGTLDPMATGLLIVGIGKATKELGKLIGLDKTYKAEITLGAESTTDDKEGIINELRTDNHHSRIPDTKDVESALRKFTGKIEQIPPAFSALKINGERAYKKARRGEKVFLKPRPVTVYSIKLIDYQFPALKIETEVSSGTYIRALARDIGKELGCGGYLSALTRTRIGEFYLSDATDLKSFQENRS